MWFLRGSTARPSGVSKRVQERPKAYWSGVSPIARPQDPLHFNASEKAQFAYFGHFRSKGSADINEALEEANPFFTSHHGLVVKAWFCLLRLFLKICMPLLKRLLGIFFLGFWKANPRKTIATGGHQVLFFWNDHERISHFYWETFFGPSPRLTCRLYCCQAMSGHDGPLRMSDFDLASWSRNWSTSVHDVLADFVVVTTQKNKLNIKQRNAGPQSKKSRTFIFLAKFDLGYKQHSDVRKTMQQHWTRPRSNFLFWVKLCKTQQSQPEDQSLTNLVALWSPGPLWAQSNPPSVVNGNVPNNYIKHHKKFILGHYKQKKKTQGD